MEIRKIFRSTITLCCLTSMFGCNLVVNKFAFVPDSKNIIPSEQLPDNVDEFFIMTEDKKKLHSYYIAAPESAYILVYFHGNAGNLCHRLSDLEKIHSFGVNVLIISYRGYGKSQGSPDEKGIYLDGEAAFKYVKEGLGFSEDKVIIFGRSLGTTVGINTCMGKTIAGLILITPLTSGRAHAIKSGFGPFSLLAGKSFNNIAKIQAVKCPLLIIHGTADQVIPFEMGKEIFNKAEVEKEFVMIKGGGHNNISTIHEKEYWSTVERFIRKLIRE
jgi:fermentation-respiration switch protein FrsA (DUF1100 family)